MLREPRVFRALRRSLQRELGPSALRSDSLAPHELRALRRARLRDLDRPALEPLPARLSAPEDQEGPTLSALHWIEIVLLGEDGQPIPGESYEVWLPDGRVQRGRLDHEGKARVEGIEQAGACKVVFPKLDEDAWSTL